MPWYVNSLLADVPATALSSIPWYAHLLVAVAIIAVSFFLGEYLGKRLRMPDHGWRISVCLFAFLASLAVVIMGPPLKKGIDLSGGALLVYEVDQSKKASDQPADMDKLISSIGRRVNPGGQKEVTIRKYGVEQVEIIVPEKERSEVERIKRLISRTGNLEFRILATYRHNKDLIERALADPSAVQIFDADHNRLAWWVPLKKGEGRGIADNPEVAKRTRKIAGEDTVEVLVLQDDYNVTGAFLSQAAPGSDDRGQPCVRFNFNSDGGQRFGMLTGDHLPDETANFHYQLGIILDGELCSAPQVNGAIYDRGEITGSFTQEAVKELVNVLNAGSLPAALTKEPISELYSGPTLGEDTIQKSTQAMIIACILVPLFMLVYYRFCGLVADIALILNMLILFAIILTIKAAMTLTGFAGLALTVGMAVDNNVLIYERLREELERGSTLRMAIRNAFQRASATIIDANVTTLIAATVLYAIGSDQVKGFAVVLWLGVAISIFTSVFVSRVILDIAEKRQWITHVKMLRLIGHTNIDFMSIFRYTLSASIIITVLAIAVAFYRGKSLFDIDFTGGVSVQALFDQPQNTADVRAKLTDKLPDLAISDVRIGDEREGLRFMINTSEPSLATVKKVLSETFGGDLKRNAITVGGIQAIEGAAAPAEKPAKTDQTRSDLPPSTMLAMADEAPSAAAPPAAAEPAPAQPAEAAPPAAPHKPSATEVMKSDKAAEKPAVEKPAVPAGPDAFAGGVLIPLKFKTALSYRDAEQLVIAAMEAVQLSPDATFYRLVNPQYTEGDNTPLADWDLKIMLPLDKAKELAATLEQQVNNNPIFPASSEIGAAVAGSTRTQALYALVASWICMIIYLWVRFQNVAFGVAAVVALIHDVFVMLGAIALSIYIAPFTGFLLVEPFKINLAIVAAFLTIIGYSVNDTIVIFDRIREVRGKDPSMTVKMVNDSTNQTMSRSVLTALTVLLVVIVLYIWGGEAVHGFAFALIVGVMTGMYSSIYIAAPILLWLIGNRGEAKQS